MASFFHVLNSERPHMTPDALRGTNIFMASETILTLLLFRTLYGWRRLSNHADTARSADVTLAHSAAAAEVVMGQEGMRAFVATLSAALRLRIAATPYMSRTLRIGLMMLKHAVHALPAQERLAAANDVLEQARAVPGEHFFLEAALLERALAMAALGQHNEAVTELRGLRRIAMRRPALKHGFYLHRVEHALHESLAALGQLVEALPHVQRAVQLAPRQPGIGPHEVHRVRMDLWRLQVLLQHCSVVIEECTATLARYQQVAPPDPLFVSETRYALATALAGIRLFPRALAQCERAMDVEHGAPTEEADPSYRLALVDLAAALCQCVRKDAECVVYLKERLRLVQAGAVVDAAEDDDAGAKAAERNFKVHYDLGEMLARLGRRDEAHVHLHAALAEAQQQYTSAAPASRAAEEDSSSALDAAGMRIVQARHCLAMQDVARGQHRSALAQLQRAEILARKHCQNSLRGARVHIAIGRVASELPADATRQDTALTCLREAAASYRSLGHDAEVVEALILMARHERLAGRHDAAASHALRASNALLRLRRYNRDLDITVCGEVAACMNEVGAHAVALQHAATCLSACVHEFGGRHSRTVCAQQALADIVSHVRGAQ